MQKLMLLFTFSLILVSCGKDSTIWPTKEVSAQSVDPATSEEFTYQFSGSRCSTGAQSAATFEEICQDLTDEELNQNCAQDKREDLFHSAQCPGSFSA